MNGGKHGRHPGQLKGLATVLRDAKRAAEKRLSCRRPETDDQLRFDRFQFGIEPRATGGDLASAGLLVNAALAPRLPLEVLDGICNVDLIPVEAGLLQTLIQKPTCGAYERPPFAVFAIAGLLAQEDHSSLSRALAEYSLGCLLIQRAAATIAHGLPQRLEIVMRGKEVRRGDLRNGLGFRQGTPSKRWDARQRARGIREKFRWNAPEAGIRRKLPSHPT